MARKVTFDPAVALISIYLREKLGNYTGLIIILALYSNAVLLGEEVNTVDMADGI